MGSDPLPAPPHRFPETGLGRPKMAHARLPRGGRVRADRGLDVFDVSTLLQRVRAEYLEMPGLALTAGQAARVFGVPEATCVRLLDNLVERGFLRRSPAPGRYQLRAGRP